MVKRQTGTAPRPRVMRPDEWTHSDPAFREWLRVMKPGGRLLIIDGDFVNPGRLERFFSALNAWSQRVGLTRPDTPAQPREMLETHRSILSRVHFSQGARSQAVVELLRAAGFADIEVDTDLGEIHRTQAKNWSLFKGIARKNQHRYAIRASKPLDAAS